MDGVPPGRRSHRRALLLVAAALTLSAGDPRETRRVVSREWLRGLVSTLGAFELLMAVTAGPTLTVCVGVVGGFALVVSPWLRPSSWGPVLVLVGTLPFAVLTWWSLVTPFLALVALPLGISVLREPASTVRSPSGHGLVVKDYPLGPATRAVNLVFRLLTEHGLGARYRHVLIVRGRTTGTPRSTPVDVMQVGGSRWLVAPYGEVNWVRNLRAATGSLALRRGAHEDALHRRRDRHRCVEPSGVPPERHQIS